MTRTHNLRMKELAVGAAMALVLAGGATAVVMPSAASAETQGTNVVVRPVWHTGADVMVVPVQHSFSDNMVGQVHRFGDDVVGTC